MSGMAPIPRLGLTREEAAAMIAHEELDAGLDRALALDDERDRAHSRASCGGNQSERPYAGS